MPCSTKIDPGQSSWNFLISDLDINVGAISANTSTVFLAFCCLTVRKKPGQGRGSFSCIYTVQSWCPFLQCGPRALVGIAQHQPVIHVLARGHHDSRLQNVILQGVQTQNQGLKNVYKLKKHSFMGTKMATCSRSSMDTWANNWGYMRRACRSLWFAFQRHL